MSSSLPPQSSKIKRTLRRIGLAGAFLLFSIFYCAGIALGLSFVRADQITAYPIIYFYNYTALLITVIAAIALVILIIIRIFKRFRLWPFALAALLLLIGSAFIWNFYYEELDTISFGDHVYHLGIKGEPPLIFAEFAYVLCKCDSADMLCQCHDFYWTRGTLALTTMRLAIDQATQQIKAEVNDTTVYINSDPPQCYKFDMAYGDCTFIKQ